MKIASLHNLSTGKLIGHGIRCADQSMTRIAGLLGRASLPAGEGLWIKPSSGIHTFGMRFSIDVLGLDNNLRIVKMWPEVRPYRITVPNLSTRSVVELAAGEIRACALRVGDVLRFDFAAR